MTMKKSSLLLLLFNLIVIASFAQRTLIHCGSIIDGKNKQLLQQMTIVVKAIKSLPLIMDYKAWQGRQANRPE